MKTSKLTIEVLATNMDILRVILGHTLKLSEKKTGTFLGGFTFPETFKQYAITFFRGGAIIPGISPEQLGEMICRAAYYRFHSIKESLENDLRGIFEIPVPLKLSMSDRQGYWTLRVSSPAIPMDWWNEDFGGDEILTECFFQGSVEPMRSFHDLENWKREIQENAAIQKRRREHERKEEESFLADPNHLLHITIHISNSNFDERIYASGTPVQLLQYVLRNAWIWEKDLAVFKRGFRIKIDGKQDWAFYTSKDALLAALKKAWPVAYERAEATQS